MERQNEISLQRATNNIIIMVPRQEDSSMSSIPIFLLPNTFGLHLADSVAVVPKSVGWESFPPLVESLDDEELQQDDENACPNPCTSFISNTRRYNSSTKKQQRSKKSVSFSKVMIREHSIIVGDHPCAESLALSLDWAHTIEPKIMDVNTYEAIRAGHRRTGSDMTLSFYEKKNLLKRVGGLSEREIAHEQRRDYFHDMENPVSLRRVQTVAAMQLHAHAHHAAHCASINPGCPINSPSPEAPTVTACV